MCHVTHTRVAANLDVNSGVFKCSSECAFEYCCGYHIFFTEELIISAVTMFV